MGDLRKRLVELAASVARGNYDPTEPPPGRWSRVQKWRDHDAAVERLKRLGLAIKDIADGEAKATTDALRSIATIIGCPADTDPLTDLDGLVMAVRGMAERATGLRAQLIDVTRTNTQLRAQEQAITDNMDARIADAVAAERHAIGAWLRAIPPTPGIDSAQTCMNARAIEHGDHIDDDAPPLPSLRMTLLLRDELHRQIATLTAARDAYRAELDRLKAHTEATSPAGVGVEFGGPA